MLAFLAGALTAFTCFYFGLKFNVQIQRGEIPRVELPELPKAKLNPFEAKSPLELDVDVLDEYLNGPKKEV